MKAFFRHTITPLLGVLSCLLVALPAAAQTPAETAAAVTPAAGAPGSSDSGELENRILFRVRKALKDESPGGLGGPKGYNWIFMVQAARYRDSNVRLTNTRRGVQRFLDALIADRKTWPIGQVQDTVTVIPYHFNILGEARERNKPLRDYLTDATKLKADVPGLPLDDVYMGQKWRDGHDWRSAMRGTLEWMKKNDIEPEHTVVIVLDWNDLAQAPQVLATGASPAQPATDKNLVLPTNKALYAGYTKAMTDNGFDPKRALETVQVGNLEYDMAVLTPEGLKPLDAADAPPATAAAPAATATPEPAASGGGGAGPLIALLLLLALGAAAFVLVRPINVRLDEQETRVVGAIPPKTVAIVAKSTEASGPHYRLTGVPLATDRPLATLSSAVPRKLIVTNGACNVQNTEGFVQAPNGLKLQASSGEFDLVDPTTGKVIASVSVRTL